VGVGSPNLELHNIAVVQRLEERHLLAELVAGCVALIPQHLHRHRVHPLQHRLVHLRCAKGADQLPDP